MRIEDCINQIKESNSKRVVQNRITRLWICPEIVKHPKIGKDYVVDTGINAQISESLLNMEVKKHWIENNDCLSIIFKVPGYPDNYLSDDFELPEY